MNLTRDDLEKAGCWFDSDGVGGSEMTAFKRAARWRQHQWAVEELGITEFGTHLGRRTRPDVPPDEIRNGTKLLPDDADRGYNFLTPALHRVAQSRVADKQLHETLNATRLFRDLLSSMPMAFNLFGEAALPENEASRKALTKVFGASVKSPSDVVFEWSPARRSARYTRDRTAFDIALRLGGPNDPRIVIGIETKYHEHPTKEKKPRAAAYGRFVEQTDFLVAVAEASRVFRPGWQEKVLNSTLRQIWRDHLLTLSMRRHPDEWTQQTKYVLVYPRRNVAFSEAVRAYADLLTDEDDSFLALTIEEVLDAAFAHGGTTKDRFGRRYLW